MNMLNMTMNLLLGAKALGINFDPSGFVKMLPHMGVGMFVIFVLIGVIIMVTILINEIFSGRKK